MKRNCRFELQNRAAPRNRAIQQPHVNVVAPDPSSGGYAGPPSYGYGGWDSSSGQDVPWQGQAEERSPSHGTETPAEGSLQQQQQLEASGGVDDGQEWSTPDYWGGQDDTGHGDEKQKDDGDYFIHPGDVDGNGMGLLGCTFGGGAAEEME